MDGLRVYSATTGRCLAGDRRTDYSQEQKRVEKDFASGVALVVDERLGEIRGFVPTDRDSSEAFFAAKQFESSPSVVSYVDSVRELYDEIDSWSIRSDTLEGYLFEELSSADESPEGTGHGTFTRAADLLRDDESVRVGVSKDDAVEGLVRTRALLSAESSSFVYVLSETATAGQLEWDLLFQIGSEYDSPRILGQ